MSVPRYKDSRVLVDGFDFRHGNHKPSRVSKSVESPAASGTERDNQISLFRWCAQWQREFPVLGKIFHVPNGEFRFAKTAGLLKASGVRSGVLDTILRYIARATADTMSVAVVT